MRADDTGPEVDFVRREVQTAETMIATRMVEVIAMYCGRREGPECQPVARRQTKTHNALTINRLLFFLINGSSLLFLLR